MYTNNFPNVYQNNQPRTINVNGADFTVDFIKAYNEDMRVGKEFVGHQTDIYRQQQHSRMVEDMAASTMYSLSAPVIEDSSLPPMNKGLVSAATALVAETVTPVLFGVFLILGMMFAAVRGGLKAELKSTWREQASFYFLLVSNSGRRKSSVFDRARIPFDQFIAELKADNPVSSELERRIIDEALRDNGKRAMREHIDALFENSGDKEALRDAQQNLKAIAERLKAARDASIHSEPELFLSAATLIMLGKVMQENGHAANILEAEGDLIELILSNGELATLILRGYTGESWTYKSCRNKISVTDACIQICLYVQSHIAAGLYQHQGLLNSGLSPRFVPLFCPHGNNISAPSSLGLEEYNDKVLSLLALFYNRSEKRIIRSVGVESSALYEIDAFEKHIAENLLPQAPEKASAFLLKAHGLAVRLALAYHIWNCDESELVGNCKKTKRTRIALHEMQVGIALAKLIIPHALYAYAPDGLTAHPTACAIIKNLKSISQPEQYSIIVNGISTRTIRERIREKAAVVRRALSLLENHNIVRVYDYGDTSDNVALHPYFFMTQSSYFDPNLI
jgi:uncharacterized membrane protein